MPETRSQVKRLKTMHTEIRQRIQGKYADMEKQFAMDRLQNFRLFDLPPEVRNMIYSEVVGQPNKVIFLDDAPTPALAKVSRTLRREVLPIFVHVNTFHIMVERCPTLDSNRLDTSFKIRGETLEWLHSLGSDTPLFPNLTIHFSTKEKTELIFEANARSGVTMTHESRCCFCHPAPSAFKPIPSHKLSTSKNNEMLLRIIQQNEDRMDNMRVRHAEGVAALETVIFDVDKGIKREIKAAGLSINDVKRLESALALPISTFTLARHTACMKHLKDYPLLVRIQGKNYALRRASESEEAEETEPAAVGGSEETEPAAVEGSEETEPPAIGGSEEP